MAGGPMIEDDQERAPDKATSTESGPPPDDVEAPSEPPRALPRAAGDAMGRATALFSTLDKCMRASKLYEGRGRLVDRLIEDLFATLGHALQDGELTVTVTPFGLILGEDDVTPADSRLAEVLFRMFRDGIRELSFTPGIDEDELRSFIDVLIADPVEGEEDFTTNLWRRNLAHIHFYATDTLQAGFETSGADGLLAESQRARIQSDAQAGQEVVLSPDDLRMLKAEDGLTWIAGCTAPMQVGSLSQAQFDRVREAFQSPWDEGRFLQMAVRAAEDHPDEPSPLVLDMFDSLLSGGDIEGAARLLSAATEATKFGGRAAQSLQGELFSDERIGGLARVYERHTDILFAAVEPAAKDHPTAVVDLLNGLAPGQARDGLRDTLKEAGVDLTTFYANSLEHENEAIVLDAIRSLVGIGTDAACHSLAGALGYTSVAVRRAALEGLMGHYPEEARAALARSLGDPDRDNRMLALQILRESGDRRAAGRIMVRVQDSTFTAKDAEEQGAFVEALASFADPRTVPYFEGVLTGVNLTRNADVQARQLLAVDTLGKMDAGPAREALSRVAKKWSTPRPVKQAAKQVLARVGEA
jgi:hypothetical protein